MKSSRNLLILTAFALLIVAVVLVVRGLREASGSAENPAPSADTTHAKDHTSAAPSRREASEADRLLRSEGVTTDVALTTFPIREYHRAAAPAGAPAGATTGDAYIHVPSAGIRTALTPNQLGEYPPVETRLNDTVGVRLQLPEVKPGTPVRVVILDGGTFPADQGVSRLLEAADWRGVAFEFTTSGNIGTHRILVQAPGQPSRILDFTATDSQGS